ncbi:MAG: ABC transporter ATP-binding protein [Anaerolineae bacterium]|nr:ABC transporter ATP-binding protein [Anaerolineae bacterium]
MRGPMRHLESMPEERARNRSRVLFRLLRFLKPYRWAIAVAMILVLVSAATQGIAPMLIGQATDLYISRGEASGLALIMVLLAGVYLAGMLATRFQIFLMASAGQKLLADLRQQVFHKIQGLSLQFLESKQAGDLMSRLINDIDQLNSFFSQGLVQMIGSLFALVGIGVAMVLLNWQLGMAVLVMAPLLILTTRLFSKMARRAFRKTRETLGDVSADLQEEIGGIKVAQAFNRTDENVRRFAERNAANRDANVNATMVTSAFAPAMDVLSALDMALVAAMGGILAIRGAITVGVVVAFLQYVQNFFRPIQTVAQLWTMAQSALAAAERAFELLDTPETIRDAPNARVVEAIEGSVAFEHIRFEYEDGQPVLDDVSFSARAGQTIAIVGPTGAGKTTLVSLIARFYDPVAGVVRIDGVDIRELAQHSLRSKIGIVTQEPFLFSGSLMENIRYGRLQASDEEVMQAAKLANAHDFIMLLPDGYDTSVGERGKLLSQGQRQLVSIARAILADPRILILDEATASIDTRTEVLIQKALSTLMRGRTSFVIAHRLSTIRNADVVLVLDDGKIVEQGAHSDLIAKNGLYAELYRRQFKAILPDGTIPVGAPANQ